MFGLVSWKSVVLDNFKAQLLAFTKKNKKEKSWFGILEMRMKETIASGVQLPKNENGQKTVDLELLFHLTKS